MNIGWTVSLTELGSAARSPAGASQQWYISGVTAGASAAQLLHYWAEWQQGTGPSASSQIFQEQELLIHHCSWMTSADWKTSQTWTTWSSTKGRSKVLYLGRTNSMHQLMLRNDFKKHLVDKVVVSQQRVLTTKGKSILDSTGKSTASRIRGLFLTSWDQSLWKEITLDIICTSYFPSGS